MTEKRADPGRDSDAVLVDSGTIQATVQAQLESLYEERARLHDALGTADAEAIVAMITSLQRQLESIYEERHRRFLDRNERDETASSGS